MFSTNLQQARLHCREQVAQETQRVAQDVADRLGRVANQVREQCRRQVEQLEHLPEKRPRRAEQVTVAEHARTMIARNAGSTCAPRDPGARRVG